VELTLDNPDTVLWLGGPVVLSLGVLFAGLFVRSRSPRLGSALLVLGIGGLALSATLIAFSFSVDLVLGDTKSCWRRSCGGFSTRCAGLGRPMTFRSFPGER
jgi:hypothetical protein